MSAASPDTSERIQELTREQCAAWAENPTTNPLTGRPIEAGRAVYRAIAERCSVAFGIEPGQSPRGSRDARGSPSPRGSPEARVDGHAIPKSAAEWRNSAYRKELVGHYVVSQHFGFVVENAYPFKTLNAIASACLERGLLPEKDKALVARILRHNRKLMDTPDGVRPYAVRKEIARNYESLIVQDIRSLLNGRPRRNAVTRKDIEALMYTTRFLSYQLKDPSMIVRLDDYQQALDLLVAVEALEHDLVLARAPRDGDDADDALPASRERSLPASISQRRVRQRKPKARAEDPDEFYPWSATEEEAPTDRSRFRSHAKLSAMSPDAAALPPLTPKKRTAILAELREACTVMKDMVSMQRFDRMNKKALQLVVRLGPKGVGQQRCYYVKNLYQLWATAAKGDQPFRDPLTRAPITEAEKDAILRLARRVRPSAPDPRAYRMPRDPKLQLDIQQVSVQRADLASPSGSPSDDAVVGFYHLKVARPVGRFTFVIGDLGYVPADVQLADVGGDANLTSDAVIANLRALFDRGRLMTSHVPPYDCCRVSLGDPMDYWIAKRGARGSPGRATATATASGIHLARWRAFATEVYGAL